MKSFPTVVSLASLCVLAATGPASAADEIESHCARLYQSLSHYVLKPTSSSPSSVRLRAEVARAGCEKGDTARGIVDLERLVRNARLPVPERPAAMGAAEEPSDG
ncbi:MAG: hypothetical protein KIT25_14495 [Enhydrobacter sp.]|nr:MAG: hypothetical protein KIT25_14495 [Enhydrobacter sp.]